MGLEAVDMHVDDARRDVLAGNIDPLRIGWGRDALPDLGDLAVADQEIGRTVYVVGRVDDMSTVQQHILAASIKHYAQPLISLRPTAILPRGAERCLINQ